MSSMQKLVIIEFFCPCGKSPRITLRIDPNAISNKIDWTYLNDGSRGKLKRHFKACGCDRDTLKWELL